MPGSTASSDGFDRSPLHGVEGGGGAEEENAQDDGPDQAVEVKTERGDGSAGGEGGEEGGQRQGPNLGPVPQPGGITTQGKIFIGGLTTDTTEQDLKMHFEKFGELTDVVVMRDKATHKGRGFGFVTFKDEKNVDKVIECKGDHEIRGRQVDVKSAVRREEIEKPDRRGGPSASYDDGPIKKVFVGGLDNNTGEEEVRKYFSKFGNLEEVLT